MPEKKRRSSDRESFWGSWEAKRRLQFLMALEATPEQRLAWLEEMIALAHATGALPRERDSLGLEVVPSSVR